MQEAPAVQTGQAVVCELQFPQEGQAHGETFAQRGDLVPAQVQFLQELQQREAAVLHHTDVVVLQQQHAQLAVFTEGAFGDDGDVVVGQVEELGGGGDSAGQLGEQSLRADGELQIPPTVTTRLTAAVRPAGRLRQHQHEEQQLLHGYQFSETNNSK